MDAILLDRQFLCCEEDADMATQGERLAAVETEIGGIVERVAKLEGSTTSTPRWFINTLIGLLVAIAILWIGWVSNELTSHSPDKIQGRLDSIESRLSSIETKLSGIEAILLASRLVQASTTPADKDSQKQAREILVSAKKDAVALPNKIIEQAGKNFLEASKKEPEAWSTALEFVAYRSILNANLIPIEVQNGKARSWIFYGEIMAPPGPLPEAAKPVINAYGESTEDKAARFEKIGMNFPGCLFRAIPISIPG